jgi:hypothetical protein
MSSELQHNGTAFFFNNFQHFVAACFVFSRGGDDLIMNEKVWPVFLSIQDVFGCGQRRFVS